MNTRYLRIGFVLALLAILVAGWFLLPKPGPNKDEILANMKAAADREDYDTFAANLKIAYQKNWVNDVSNEQANDAGQKKSQFIIVESQAYVKETDYFNKGDLDRALRVSTIVYKQVPNAWRFRYLRIRTLEKLGRNALASGDLVKAEDEAKQILSMMYRSEGVNLLADVYIKKLELDKVNKDKHQAILDYNFIIGYQLTQDRLDRINQLRSEIDKLK